MYSPQIVYLLDSVPVTDVRSAVGVSPRSMDIRGRDFRSVTAVYINGQASPSFIVMNETRIIAEVPDGEKGEAVVEVAVMSASLTLTASSLVDFTVGPSPKKVRGAQRLMQEFLRILMRTPGSNKFHRDSGGGLGQRVGKNLTNSSAADITVSVNNTARYIVSKQTPVRNIPPSERLLTAEVTAVDTNLDTGVLQATILLTNHTGESAGATLIS